LEPAAGDGTFVLEAARRLIASMARRKITLCIANLNDRIRAFEIHPREARHARRNVSRLLRDLGVHHSTAAACATEWIMTADFLVSKLPANSFTHVVGNPPYVRWSKVPTPLRERYERSLPVDIVGGDLFLPFMDRSLTVLRAGGAFGLICSDRWRYMAFARGFRTRWLPHMIISSEKTIGASEAFDRAVDAYPTILIGTKRTRTRRGPLREVVPSGRTLAELGCSIRVGPALGHSAAFVLQPDEVGVEPELLRPWLDGTEVMEGLINWTGRHVIAMHDIDGTLLKLSRFPLLKKRMRRFRKHLIERSIVANGAQWFRTIDRVRVVDWTRPKLLVPELAKIPRVAIDRTGAVPSHGVYAIFAADDNVDVIYDHLSNGKLASALEGISPRVKGGYVRCYRRFLNLIRLPS
jgi:hypothetical protein